MQFTSGSSVNAVNEANALNAEDYTSIQDCQGYKEAGSPQSAGEYMVALRIIDESSGLSEDEEIQDYYTANEKLLREFIGE